MVEDGVTLRPVSVTEPPGASRPTATSDDDLLPARFSELPITVDGKLRTISRAEMEHMRRDYYRIRRWDEQGRPTGELIRHLQIERKEP